MDTKFEIAYAKAKSRITSSSDGPVDVFVAISRAISLARESGPQSEVDDPISNALCDVLHEQGWIAPSQESYLEAPILSADYISIEDIEWLVSESDQGSSLPIVA